MQLNNDKNRCLNDTVYINFTKVQKAQKRQVLMQHRAMDRTVQCHCSITSKQLKRADKNSANKFFLNLCN